MAFDITMVAPVVATISDADLMDISGGAIRTALLLAGPILIVGLVVGLIVAIFQAVTQIQEQTLVFIPKIIAIVAVLAIAGPWMLSIMVDYTTNLFENIPTIVARE